MRRSPGRQLTDSIIAHNGRLANARSFYRAKLARLFPASERAPQRPAPRQRRAKFSASNFPLARNFRSELNSVRAIQASARKYVEIGPSSRTGRAVRIA